MAFHQKTVFANYITVSEGIMYSYTEFETSENYYLCPFKSR